MTNIEKMIKEGMNAADIEHTWCDYFSSCKECPLYEFHNNCSELVSICKWMLQEYKEET